MTAMDPSACIDGHESGGMKVLTLHQPWASLVALGVKTIETRSWSTQYRGPLAIHAGAKKPARMWAEDRPDIYDAIAIERYLDMFEDYHNPGQFAYDWVGPLGAIVATCTLVDVVPIIATALVRGDPGDVSFVLTKGLNDRMWLWDGKTAADIEAQRPYGDFAPGRYAWLLADTVPVDPPVPFRGGRGLTKTWTP